METKGVLIIFGALLFVGGLFLPTENESKKIDCCPRNLYKNEQLMATAENYLNELREENKNKYFATCDANDSLHKVVIGKDKKIKYLKNELNTKPKEIIITKIDTIVVKEKKSFWGKTKVDTIK